MEIHIISEKEEKFFGRKEILVSAVLADRTPSNEEAKIAVCKKLNLSPDLTVISNISQDYGLKHCTIKIHSYKDASDIVRFEKKHLLERMKKKENKGKEAAKEEQK